MMRLTTLANGLRVASRPMQSVETIAVGLYADGLAQRAGALNGVAHLFEHMVFKGAGGRSAREISELVEDVGGDLNASTDRELTAFYVSLLAPRPGARRRAARRPGPRGRISRRSISSSRRRSSCRNWPKRSDTASDIVFDHLAGGRLSPSSRSAGRCWATRRRIRAVTAARPASAGSSAQYRARLAGPGRGRQARA